MSNTTIKQHYVWREYLRSFCFKKDSIYSLINFETIVPNNLMNVVQEKLFYKLNDINENEFQFLNDFLNSFIKEDSELKEYLKTVLYSYRVTILKGKIQDPNLRESFEKKIQNDYFEYHMTRSESYGKKLLSVKTLEDLKECLDVKNRFQTILFLTIQSFRTKNQKQKLIKEFEGTNIKIDKFWFFISYTIGNLVAWNLIRTRQFKATILLNKTYLEFLTSDQPVINIDEEKDIDGNIMFFKLYIPINPKVAVILDFDSIACLFDEVMIFEDKFVEDLNHKIISNSNMFLFSKSIETLEKAKQHITVAKTNG